MLYLRAGVTVEENKDGELVLDQIQSGWRVCIDYRKLNTATRKDHFSLPLLIRWWSAWQGMSTIVSWMVILDITKSLWTSKIRRRRLSLVLIGRSPTVACPVGYAMHPLLFSSA